MSKAKEVKPTKIPQEIKGFIQELKEMQVCHWEDKRGDFIYLPPDNRLEDPVTLSSNILRNLFNKSCRGLDWAAWEGYIVAALPHVVGYTYTPLAGGYVTHSKAANTKLLNKYLQPQQSIQAVTNIKPFTDYLERMFPVDKERHVITQWLAHLFQRPEQRPSWHLLITSDHGTGKGYLYKEVLFPLLDGMTSKCETSYAPLFDKHSHHLNCTQLCILDDCVETGKKDTYDKMKSLLSEEFTTYEQKYLDPRTIPVFTRIISNNNPVRPFRVPEEDRRWFAPKYIELPQDGVSTSVYLNLMDEYLENEDGLNQIYNYFMSYSLEGFNHKETYQTDTLLDIIGLSVSTMEQEVADWINKTVVFKSEDLVSRFSDFPDLARSKASSHCSRKNTNMDGNGNSRWWVLKGVPTRDARLCLEAKKMF